MTKPFSCIDVPQNLEIQRNPKISKSPEIPENPKIIQRLENRPPPNQDDEVGEDTLRELVAPNESTTLESPQAKPTSEKPTENDTQKSTQYDSQPNSILSTEPMVKIYRANMDLFTTRSPTSSEDPSSDPQLLTQSQDTARSQNIEMSQEGLSQNIGQFQKNLKSPVKGKWLVLTKKLTKENILHWTQNSMKFENRGSGLSLPESEKSENIEKSEHLKNLEFLANSEKNDILENPENLGLVKI